MKQLKNLQIMRLYQPSAFVMSRPGLRFMADMDPINFTKVNPIATDVAEPKYGSSSSIEMMITILQIILIYFFLIKYKKICGSGSAAKGDKKLGQVYLSLCEGSGLEL